VRHRSWLGTTPSVSLALARAGYSVTAADALTFPVIHARTRLLAKKAPAFKALGGYDNALDWLCSVAPVKGYFFQEFGEAGRPANGRAPRLYFSAANAARIDGIRDGIRKLATSRAITKVEHSVLLHHLIMATIRIPVREAQASWLGIRAILTGPVESGGTLMKRKGSGSIVQHKGVDWEGAE